MLNKGILGDSLFHLTGHDDPIDVAIRSMELNFELPQEFRNPDKFNPSDVGDEFFMNVPSVVAAAIFDAIGENVPIDPSVPLIYLRSDRLPQFVPAWFMAAMPTGGKRLGKSTKFYRALHAIERYREYIMYPADPAIPEYILAGAGSVPPEHFAPGSGATPSLDELEKEAQRLREAAGSEPSKVPEVVGSDVTKEAEGDAADDEDGHNNGFVDDEDDQ